MASGQGAKVIILTGKKSGSVLAATRVLRRELPVAFQLSQEYRTEIACEDGLAGHQLEGSYASDDRRGLWIAVISHGGDR